MMEQVIKECPKCKSVLKVKITAGSRERTIKCPKCQTPITVQFGDAPANATHQASPSSNKSGAPQKNHKWLIAALVAVILILVGVVIGLLVPKGSGGAPQPSGDPAKDAEAVVEYVLDMMDKVKDKDSHKKFLKAMKKLEKQFDKYYKDMPDEYKEFEKEVQKYESEVQEKYEEVEERMEDED